MKRLLKPFLDARVITYGVILPAAIYMTAAVSLESSRAESRQTTQQLRSGTEVVAVLITSSTCAGNRYENFQEIIRNANRELEDRARKEGWTPRRVGVALDWDVDKGLEALRAFGPWDEISIGNNWVNSAALRYMVVDQPGPLTIPQLVLIQRQITVETGKPLRIHGERVLHRVAGADHIDAWVHEGMPFDLLAAESSPENDFDDLTPTEG